MKLLHTADLHLGKTLHEMPLFAEQEKMLSDIYHILRDDHYAALIIAGDVYDGLTPSGKTVSLFGRFLASVRSDCPHTAIFIIPGNHDSSQRLAFANTILQNERIFITGNTDHIAEPVILRDNGEELAVYALPFLSFGSFSGKKNAETEKTGNSQAEMAAIASDMLKNAVRTDIPSVLIAHLFTLGGSTSSSERTFLGTAEYIHPALFSFFSYTALGHLHRYQKVTDRMYYSGSPLAYAFDEAGDTKYVLSVDIDCRTPTFPLTVTPIQIKPQRPLSRLEGSSTEFLNGTFSQFRSHYLEITLTDGHVITNPMQLLRTQFEHILSIKQKSIMNSTYNTAHDMLREQSSDDPQSIEEHFTLFEQYIGHAHSEEKSSLFAALCKEGEHEA